MQKQKIAILLLILIHISSMLAYSQNAAATPAYVLFSQVTQHLSENEIDTLRTKEALSYTSRSRDKKRLQYIPPLEHFTGIQEFVRTQKPTILYETLYFIPIENYEAQSSAMVRVFNYFRDLPNFVTIRYRNIKKGHIYPLFLSSQQIVSENDTSSIHTLEPVSALGYRSINKAVEQIITVLQDMPPFGDVISYYDYSYDQARMSFTSGNMTPIGYKGIKAVDPYNMLSAARILRTDEGVLIYGIGAVRIKGLAVLFSGVIANSFESRMVGLFSWVKNEHEGKPQLK